MPPILLVVGSYLLGAIPFAWVVVKLTLRKDVRDHGSGNVGNRDIGSRSKQETTSSFAASIV